MVKAIKTISKTCVYRPSRAGRGFGDVVGIGDGMGEQVTAGGVDRFSQTVGSSDAEAPGPANTQTDGLTDKTWKR